MRENVSDARKKRESDNVRGRCAQPARAHRGAMFGV
jgi:hypothetical protein